MYGLVEKQQNEYLSTLLSRGLYDKYILIVSILTGKLINGVSYMSTLDFIDFIKWVDGKRDKMCVLPSILSLFRNKFNKFNNTGA